MAGRSPGDFDDVVRLIDGLFETSISRHNVSYILIGQKDGRIELRFLEHRRDGYFDYLRPASVLKTELISEALRRKAKLERKGD